MDLFFDPGRTNTLRERTTGILSDLLSEVIERVRSKTGEDMLGVAEGLNRHNTLLHSIPLKEGVKDVCSAIKEHAVSRKRKRTSGPSDSESSDKDEMCNGDVTNGHNCVVDEKSGKTNNISDDRIKKSENEELTSSASVPCVDDESMEVSVSENKCQQKVESEKNESLNNLNPTQLVSEPSDTVSDNFLPPKQPLRTSSRRAKLDAKKEALKLSEPKPAPSPSPAPSSQPPPQKKQIETKPKKKRKSLKELHKKCDRQFIKLEDVMLTDAPLLLDGDSDDEDRELVSLVESECPSDWVVGKPRSRTFRRKYFCKPCTFGEKF